MFGLPLCWTRLCRNSRSSAVGLSREIHGRFAQAGSEPLLERFEGVGGVGRFEEPEFFVKLFEELDEFVLLERFGRDAAVDDFGFDVAGFFVAANFFFDGVGLAVAVDRVRDPVVLREKLAVDREPVTGNAGKAASGFEFFDEERPPRAGVFREFAGDVFTVGDHF